MIESMQDCGVIYIVAGEKYAEEAANSADSLLDHNDLEIHLYADKAYQYEVFDEISVLNSPRYDQGDSIPRFNNLSFKRTLFLDSDTYICGDISPIFESLKYFDIACAFNIGTEVSYNELDQQNNMSLPHLPDVFPELNSGVIGFRKTSKMEQFLERWKNLYDNQQSMTRNQPAFRQALYDSELRLLTLPREYNYRLPKIAAVHGGIKIIHGRHPCSYEDIAECLNSTSEKRVITKKDWPMGVIPQSDISLKFRLYYNLKTRGIKGTFEKALSKMRKRIE